MAIKDIFNSIKDSLSSKQTYVAPQPEMITPQKVQKTVDPKKIPEILRYLESSGGLDPNTPRNQIRSYMIPAANQNEKPRTVSYNIGHGGEYGLTPVALAELAKSTVDRNAATSTYTKFGPPVIPGIDPRIIQKELMSVEGAGRIADMYFNKRPPADFSPETLANHYVDYYVGKGTPSDTPKNRKRVLDYYNSIAQ